PSGGHGQSAPLDRWWASVGRDCRWSRPSSWVRPGSWVLRSPHVETFHGDCPPLALKTNIYQHLNRACRRQSSQKSPPGRLGEDSCGCGHEVSKSSLT